MLDKIIKSHLTICSEYLAQTTLTLYTYKENKPDTFYHFLKATIRNFARVSFKGIIMSDILASCFVSF